MYLLESPLEHGFLLKAFHCSSDQCKLEMDKMEPNEELYELLSFVEKSHNDYLKTITDFLQQFNSIN